MRQTIAVLTGDIVASTSLPSAELDRLFLALENAVADMQQWPGAPDHVIFSRHRGDGWQLVLPRADWAVRACLMLRAGMRSADSRFETRIGVGLGDGGEVDTDDPGASGGAAFERSGRCLDELAKHFFFGITTGSNEMTAALLNDVLVLVDALSRQWTPRQAEAFCHLLHPASPSQAKIGSLLTPPIKQAAVAERYLAGSGPALMHVLDTIEERILRADNLNYWV